jgi:hypothetical protein
MANPSTASATEDDATIRKCIGFSKHAGFGRMIVVNLYALRSRDPKTLRKATTPIGPMNDYWIQQAIGESREIICAWGCAEHLPEPEKRVEDVLRVIGYYSESTHSLLASLFFCMTQMPSATDSALINGQSPRS